MFSNVSIRQPAAKTRIKQRHLFREQNLFKELLKQRREHRVGSSDAAGSLQFLTIEGNGREPIIQKR